MFECGASAVEILDVFSPGHISVSVEVFSRKSANLLYYILNYGLKQDKQDILKDRINNKQEKKIVVVRARG
jgi:hypothetical protein